MKTLLSTLFALLALTSVNAQAVPIFYDEGVSGDLSPNTADTALGGLDTGLNIVRGSVTTTIQFRDIDGFNVTLAAGLTATSIEFVVTSFSASDGTGFLFVGSSILGGSAGGFVSGNSTTQIIGMNPFFGPVVGPHALNLQVAGPSPGQTGGFDYEWRISVAGVAVPEPTTLGLLAAGLIGFGLTRRRRRTP